MKAGQVGPDLMLQSREEGKPPVKIQHRSNFEAHKTLGTHKSPSGRQKKQRDVLRQKSDDFARVVKCGHISRKEATAFYRAIYLTSMGYPLPVCFFNKSELSRIQQKAMVALKSKMGYNSRTANAIIYGPTRLGGCGFRHLYVEQGMGQIHLFLRHWRSNSQAGRLLRIALCWVQFSAGTGTSILQDTKTHLPHLESKWIKSLRIFLRSIGATLEIDTTFVQPLQREFDHYLMEMILLSGKFNEVEILNCCRLYLQAVTLSDITNAAGTRLDDAMMKGRPGPFSSRTKLHYVVQERPNDASWILWRKACRIWSRPDNYLHQSLGK